MNHQFVKFVNWQIEEKSQTEIGSGKFWYGIKYILDMSVSWGW